MGSRAPSASTPTTAPASPHSSPTSSRPSRQRPARSHHAYRALRRETRLRRHDGGLRPLERTRGRLRLLRDSRAAAGRHDSDHGRPLPPVRPPHPPKCPHKSPTDSSSVAGRGRSESRGSRQPESIPESKLLRDGGSSVPACAARYSTRYGAVVTSFVFVVFAEFGDKTQALTIALAGTFPDAPLSVFVGVVTALGLRTGVDVIIGERIERDIPPRRWRSPRASSSWRSASPCSGYSPRPCSSASSYLSC